VLTGLVAWFFGERLDDSTGYRIMSRFVKSFPARSGFETEADSPCTRCNCACRLPNRDPYRERPPASAVAHDSDGIRILRLITR
jgi:hypothetical protein